jgi:alpha-glucosidase
MINCRDSEPWAFGEDTEQVSRNYIRLRYQLMPYLYSCFYEASRTGMPVQRSLAIHYTHNPNIYKATYQHQYLFGPGILVAPVESEKELVKVYLPTGSWYYLFNGKPFQGDQEIIVECPPYKLPIFVKGGAIIPMQQPAENTKVKQPILYLHVYHGPDDTSFDYYTDDGETFDYQRGTYSLRKISYLASEKKIVISLPEGTFASPVKTVKLMLHGFKHTAAKVDGQSVMLNAEKLELFLPMEKFDPLYDPDTMGSEEVLTTVFPLHTGEIKIELQ